MSKKKFEAPIAEIIHIEAADVLTSSGDPFDGEWVPISPTDNDENNDLFIY